MPFPVVRSMMAMAMWSGVVKLLTFRHYHKTNVYSMGGRDVAATKKA